MTVRIVRAACALCILVGCSSEDATQWENVRVASASAPIIGGQPDSDLAHSAVVLLLNTTDDSVCTGVVLSQVGEPAVVLTARHCVSAANDVVSCNGSDIKYDYDVENIAVMRGAGPGEPNAGLLGSGKRAFFMPADATGICNNDVAVILLDAPNTVEPLRLRTDPARLAVGQQFAAIGYGARQDPDPSGQTVGLRYIREGVQVTTVGPVSPSLFDREFFGTEGICVGDSGGPAVAGNTVVGVASRVSECYGGTGLWGRPEMFLPLIEEAFRKSCASFTDEDGTAYPTNPDPGCPGGDASGGSAGGEAGGAGGQDNGTDSEHPGQAGSAGAGATNDATSDGDSMISDEKGTCAASVAGSGGATSAAAALLLVLSVAVAFTRRKRNDV